MDITSEVQQRLSRIEPVLLAAGSRLLSMQTGALEIGRKSNFRDLVTAADLESERLILDAIMQAYPGDRILAEESGQGGSASEAPFIWVVDPLDGTVNYAHGLPLFCISVGLVHLGRPVGGIVLVPALNEVYRAVEGKGAFKNKKTIGVSSVDTIRGGIVATGFPYEREKVLEQLVGGVRAILETAGGIRRTGSAALDLVWLAEGRLDAYYELNLKPWDTAGGMVIVKEAGGVVSDLNGQAYDPFQSFSIVASNGRFHDHFLSILNPVKGS